jgi:tetratricopeptide (TPR) repeat protein
MSLRSFPFLLLALSLHFLAEPMLRAESAEELVKAADVHDQKFDAKEALALYRAAEKLDPKDFRILTRIARQYRHLMADAGSKEEKTRLGYMALEYSKRAAALGPNDAEAQLSVAISYGKLLPILGKKEQVDASPRIKASVDRALALDPRNDLAWHILGRWHRVLADVTGVKRVLAGALYGGLPTGSYDEAIRSLQKAIALNGTRLMHQIELGRIYAQMGRKEDARKYLSKGLAMPSREKDDAEMKERGREALAKL